MKKLMIVVCLIMGVQMSFAQSKTKMVETKKVETKKGETKHKKLTIDQRATLRTDELHKLVGLKAKQKTTIYSIHFNFITRNEEIRSNKKLSQDRKVSLIKKSNVERYKLINSELTKEQQAKLKASKFQEKLDKATLQEVK